MYRRLIRAQRAAAKQNYWSIYLRLVEQPRVRVLLKLRTVIPVAATFDCANLQTRNWRASDRAHANVSLSVSRRTYTNKSRFLWWAAAPPARPQPLAYVLCAPAFQQHWLALWLVSLLAARVASEQGARDLRTTLTARGPRHQSLCSLSSRWHREMDF